MVIFQYLLFCRRVERLYNGVGTFVEIFFKVFWFWVTVTKVSEKLYGGFDIDNFCRGYTWVDDFTICNQSLNHCMLLVVFYEFILILNYPPLFSIHFAIVAQVYWLSWFTSSVNWRTFQTWIFIWRILRVSFGYYFSLFIRERF